MVFSTIPSSSNSASTLRRKRQNNINAPTKKQSTRLALLTSVPLKLLLGSIAAIGSWNGIFFLTRLPAEDSVFLSLSTRHMQEEAMGLLGKSVASQQLATTYASNEKDETHDVETRITRRHASDRLPSLTNINTEPANLDGSRRRRLYERLANATSRRGKSFSLSTPDNPCPHVTGKEKSIMFRSESSSGTNISSSSTVEFSGCCGLGHRLLRMSCAAHVAQKMQAQLYGYWGCCNEKEVFTELFGETALLEPLNRADEDSSIYSRRAAENRGSREQFSNHLMFRFEVAGFESIYKEKRRFLNRTREIVDTNNAPACPLKCSPDKIRSDYRFYTALMKRYRQRHVVDDFVQEHFTDKLALGLHIRAGNDEKGDFERKGRVIADKKAFVQDTIAILNQLVANANALTEGISSNNDDINNNNNTHGNNVTRLAPILFIATDTQSYIEAFRQGLKDTMSVVNLPHVIRQNDGQGVLFGEMVTVTTTGENCLLGWQSALEDMMILSQTDIVLAPKHSSFTQTMPLSVVLGRPKRRHTSRKTIAAPFCETIATQSRKKKQTTGTGFQCYESVQDWCCRNEIPRAAYFDVKPDWRDIL